MKTTKKEKRDAKQLYRLCLVNGLLDESRVRQVVQSVIAAGERGCQSILTYFLRLVKLDYAEHTANIQSATPLPADLQTVVRSGVMQQYGPGLTTSFVENPELIGGMRIQVGCDVYDGSVRARLEALAKSFDRR
jgi:F-type H+-transporting ATPase subunit delta